MLYALRDASDWDRLGGTTFIQMNSPCALSMAAHGLYIAGGIATSAGAPRALCAIFGVLFACNGISSYSNKPDAVGGGGRAERGYRIEQ